MDATAGGSDSRPTWIVRGRYSALRGGGRAKNTSLYWKSEARPLLNRFQAKAINRLEVAAVVGKERQVMTERGHADEEIEMDGPVRVDEVTHVTGGARGALKPADQRRCFE